MQRVGTYIQKLQEQLAAGEDSARLLVTAQLLLAELQQQPAPPTGRVAVVLPVTNTVAEIPNIPESVPTSLEQFITTIPKAPVAASKANRKEEQSGWLFNPAELIPTLAHQPELRENHKEMFELNDVITEEAESLNDRLRQDKTELGTVLKEQSIRDLKKAIGINDRYRFINELFRGDETMYERSIKTINGFNILAEAEYWIQRELKVKMGWDETADGVHLFDELVRRRFS
jgi:hypothetical protein